MNKNYLKIFFAGLVFLCLTLPVDAQRSNGLTVEGTVSVEEGSVDGAIIQMFRDGRRLDNYGIGANGSYRVELNYNHEWILIFTRPGNFPQKIVVDAKVPREVLQSDPLFPPFPVDIKLFTEISGIERTFSENTVLKIYYSNRVDNFILDLYYNDAQIKHLIDQAILQSQMIDREADFLAGLTRAEMAELRREYDQLIKAAENEYKNEKFLDALDGYQAASRVFPKEQYPKDRIAEINDLLGLLMVAEEMQLALAERLQQLLAQADALYEAQNYTEARNAYHRALSVDPANQHAQQRSDEIAEILRMQQTDQEYRNLITQGDNSFRELLYMDAKNAFQQALRLKQDEAYPQQRINEIDHILSQQTQNAERLESYQEAVFQAELNFEKQFYERAISFYETALTHQPGDEVAKRRIQEIRDIMNELANRTLYDRVIRTADRAFQRSQYSEALPDYEQAAELLPNEEYPKEQINRIRTIFEEQERLAAEAEAAEQARLAALQAEQDLQYAQAVSRGDSLFNLNEYETSRTAYQSALQVKPDETYPQQRIDEIGSILQEREQINREYQNAVALADQQFNSRDYSNARTNYEKALEIKPEESYPQEKINEVDRILAQQELDENYRTIILAADGFFNTESWNEAKTEYEKALEIKPDENYPKSQIVKIDNLLRQQQERVLAEQRAAENMERRRAEIEQRQRQMSDRQEMSESGLNQLYNEYISLADGFFDNRRYNVSRAWYYKAWDVKPEETYPPQRIEEINRLVGSLLLSQRDRDYQNFVNLADSTFRENQLAVARGWYNRALSVKSEETYPREQLQAIADLIAERMASRSGEQFNSHMQNATEAFENGNYNVARFWYRKALELRPDDSKVKDGLQKLEETIR